MIKRSFDTLAASVALVVLSPILVLVAIAIRVESRGPVLHRAVRVGRHRVPFTLLKFRSMRVGSDAGPAITASGDSRITRSGRVCRKLKLDELPQLWNVIRGDMSLVGPRPEDPRYVLLYSDEQLRLLDWRPGITSPASVTYRDEEGVLADAVARGLSLEEAYREVLNSKLAIELAYFPTATLGSDIRWMLRTIAAIAR